MRKSAATATRKNNISNAKTVTVRTVVPTTTTNSDIAEVVETIVETVSITVLPTLR